MCFKYGGKSRTSLKTDDEELEIGSLSIYERRKQNIQLPGHQATYQRW